jgi:septum formation protein
MIWKKADKPAIILASGSPRRRQILEQAGIAHEVIISDVDETIDGEPDYQVKELALRKARAVRDIKTEGALPLPPHSLFEKSEAKTLTKDVHGTLSNDGAKGLAPCRGSGTESPRSTLPIILAADTLVYIDGRMLGKPKNEDEAFTMLRRLSGQAHTVYTGVAILRGGEELVFVDAARVYFRSLSDEEIRAYIATGEPMDKAGAYGVQERGAVLVDRVEGDFYTVVGLPISKVVCALGDMGYDIW